MAIASWMIRGRSLRSGRFNRNRLDCDDENVQLDLSKDPKENIQEILNHVCQRHGVVEGRRLGYLNAFVQLVSHRDVDQSQLGYSKEELLCCLRTALVHEATQVRAAGLRAVRYLIQDENDVKILSKLQIPSLVARSLDLALRNDMERIQAMRTMRRILAVNPADFPVALVQCLVSLSNGASEANDRMLRASLAILCEVCVLNPFLLLKCGGITSIVRNVLDCGLSRVSESLVGCLLYLLDRPETRSLARVDLHCFAEPFCDFYFQKSCATSSDRARDEREVRERETRLHASHYAILSVLRSWPGLLHFCNPWGNSGLRAIVDVLYLKQSDIRKAVLDLLYDLLGIPLPEWTDEFSVALDAMDPSHPQDSWRLNEGFIAAEGRAILPHLSKFRPNIVINHLAALLQAFLDAGLLAAIVEVIVAEDTFLSVRATILLGQLLHMMHLLLPPDCCNVSPPLPTLMWYAVGASYIEQLPSPLSMAGPSQNSFHSEVFSASQPALNVTKGNQQQALASVAAMNQLHRLLKRRPAPASLFLAQVLNSASRYHSESRRAAKEEALLSEVSGPNGTTSTDSNKSTRKRQRRFSESMLGMTGRGRYTKSKLQQIIAKESENALKESYVLTNKDGFSWNWDVIRSILKSGSEALLKLEDSNHRTFVKRLIHYYKPSSNRFSRVEHGGNRKHPNIYTLAGIELLDVLLRAEEVEGSKLLMELLGDISSQIEEILTAKSAHDCLFSPQHTSNSLCQDYFLFIGHLCQSRQGHNILESTGLMALLLRLVVNTNHDCYVKLVISSLDYAAPKTPRNILQTVLTTGSESSRLYATQFMGVLLRAGVPNFDQWGISLLLKQREDKSKSVSLAALNILDEACDEPLFIQALAEKQPNFNAEVERELLLQIRLLSTPVGFAHLQRSGFLATQLRYWAVEFNYRYVRFVEGEVHDSLSLHQRGEDGHYNRRVSSAKHSVKDVFLPPHLYGQLTQHPQGFQLLLQDSRVMYLLQVVKCQQCNTEEEILEIKAALWAAGNIASSTSGLKWLSREGVIHAMISLAQNCLVYSIRATVFYVIGLVATTAAGADVLATLGWMSVRHHRLERWPVIYQNLQVPPATAMQEELYCQEAGTAEDTETESSVVTEEDDSSLWDDSASRNGVQFWNEASPIPGETLTSRKSRTLPHQRVIPDCLRKQQRSLSESQSSSPQLQRVCSPISSSATTTSTGAEVHMLPANSAPDGSVSTSAMASSSFTSMTKASDDTKSRSNSCSDSGVCSCDSTLAKQTSDRIQTLSPIPSSTSLNTLKSTSVVCATAPVTHLQPEVGFRRTSLQGSVTSEHISPTHSTPNSRLSQHDMAGYATLRSLQRHQRPQLPTLSYSLHHCLGATDTILDDLQLLSSSSSRGRFGNSGPSSILNSMRRLKVRSLDRQSSHPLFLTFDPKLSDDVVSDLPAATSSPTKSSLQSLALNNKQCYMGISLPLSSCSLYPASLKPTTNRATTETADIRGQQQSNTSDHDDVVCDTQVENRTESKEKCQIVLSLNEKERVREMGQESDLPRSLQPSSDSDVELESEEGVGSRFDKERGRGYRRSLRGARGARIHVRRRRDRMRELSYTEVRPYIHQTSSCLVCALRQSHSSGGTLRERKISAGSYYARARTETESSCGTADAQESPSRQRTISGGVFGGSLESTTSTETVGSVQDGFPGGSGKNRAVVRSEVMRHVECMSNPIWIKACKQALLQAKQKYPQMLDDVCLYSDICDSLAASSYRLQARRFLQEIFLDMSFSEIFEEAVNILKVSPAAAHVNDCPPVRSISVSLPPSEGLVSTGAVKIIESQNPPPLSMVIEEHSGSEERRGSFCSAPGSIPRLFVSNVAVPSDKPELSSLSSKEIHLSEEATNSRVKICPKQDVAEKSLVVQPRIMSDPLGNTNLEAQPMKKTVFNLLSQIDAAITKRKSEPDNAVTPSSVAFGEADHEEPRSPVRLLSCRLQSGDREDTNPVIPDVNASGAPQTSPTRIRKVATVCQPSIVMLQSDGQSKS